MAHLGVIWIGSSKSVLVFFTIGYQKVIESHLSLSFCIQFFRSCFEFSYREEDCVGR
jgi:hypothetical protein